MTATTGTIAMSLAQDIRREHEAAQQAFASAVEHAVRCGELLAEAKAQVRHGAWLPWLAENFLASVRTAQGYMRLAAASVRGGRVPDRRLAGRDRGHARRRTPRARQRTWGDMTAAPASIYASART